MNNPLIFVDSNGLDCIYTSNESEDSVDVHILLGDCTSSTDDGVFVDGTVDASSFSYDGSSISYNFSPSNSPDYPGFGVITGVYSGQAVNAIDSDPTGLIGVAFESGFVMNAIGQTIAAAANNIANTIANAAKLNKPAPPQRLFGTNYCGPGGAGNTSGHINGPCSVHDKCFKDKGLSFADYAMYQLGGNVDASALAGMKSCNQQLCSAVNANASNFSEAGDAWLINVYFQCQP